MKCAARILNGSASPVEHMIVTRHSQNSCPEVSDAGSGNTGALLYQIHFVTNVMLCINVVLRAVYEHRMKIINKILMEYNHTKRHICASQR